MSTLCMYMCVYFYLFGFDFRSITIDVYKLALCISCTLCVICNNIQHTCFLRIRVHTSLYVRARACFYTHISGHRVWCHVTRRGVQAASEETGNTFFSVFWEATRSYIAVCP